MNSFSKFALVSILSIGSGTMAFAAPDRILDFGDTVTPTIWTAQATVAPSDALLTYLAEYGIKGAIDPAKGAVDQGQADAFETLISDQLRRTEIYAIVEPELASHLAWGSVDSVEMRVGRHVFNLSQKGV